METWLKEEGNEPLITEMFPKCYKLQQRTKEI